MGDTSTSLGRRVIIAAQWRAGTVATQFVFQLGMGIVLARLLPASDFGLVALAMSVIGLSAFGLDFGLASAIIRDPRLTPMRIRVGYTASLCIGLVTTAILIAGSHDLARLMAHVEVAPVLAGLALTFLIGSLSNVSRALMLRQLDFRMAQRIEVMGMVCNAAVSISLALLGFGVWSLVLGTLCQRAAASALTLRAYPHSLFPTWDRGEASLLLSFGTKVSLSTLANYIALNADNFLVGRFIGTAALGYYTRAYSLMNLPTVYAASVSSQVLLPALSTIGSEGAPDRVREAYLTTVEFMSLVAAPVMVGMFITAEHLILALYGASWEPAVVPFRVLCVVGYFRCLYHLGGVVAQSAGRPDLELKAQLIYAALVIGLVLIGVRSGLFGVSIGVGVAIVTMYGMMSSISWYITRFSLANFLRAQLPGCYLALAVAAAALPVKWYLESRHVGSGIVCPILIVTCAGAVVTAIPFMPNGLRPGRLFGLLRANFSKLPQPFGLWLDWSLRT